MTKPVIENVRSSLAHSAQTLLSSRPDIFPARQPGTMDSEIEQFLKEIKKLSGTAQQLGSQAVFDALKALVSAENIRKATVWDCPLLKQLFIVETLSELGVELVSPNASKHEMALCDLGITTADYLLPETGTLVLTSSVEKPRGVSLLPRIHLAIVTPEMLRADLHQVFAEARNSHYLVFITGPSRTADIELTVTLGVHGPKNLFVWMLGNPE
jgi:L-lactate dehydrogenase complex protein LldG